MGVLSGSQARLTIAVKIVFVAELVLEGGDDVGVVDVHVLDAAGEVLVHHQTVLDVGNASDVEVAIEVQLHEVALDAVADSNPVHRHDDVTALPGDEDLVEGVVVKQRPQGHRSLEPAAEVDVEQQPVLNQLQREVIPLRAFAVQDDAVLFVRLEPEAEDVPEGGHRMSGQLSPDERRSVEMQDVRNVVTAVDLDPQGYPVLPTSGVHPKPLSNDRLLEVVPSDVVPVDIAGKELGQSVHLLVVGPVLAVGSVLYPVLEDKLVGMCSALAGDAGDVFDRSQVDDQGLVKVRTFGCPC